MAIADNVAEIIRCDRELAEMVSKKVISLADVKEQFRWLKQQRSYQVRAIRNYQPPSSSIR